MKDTFESCRSDKPVSSPASHRPSLPNRTRGFLFGVSGGMVGGQMERDMTEQETILKIARLAMRPNIKSPDEILRGLKAKPSKATQRMAA